MTLVDKPQAAPAGAVGMTLLPLSVALTGIGLRLDWSGSRGCWRLRHASRAGSLDGGGARPERDEPGDLRAARPVRDWALAHGMNSTAMATWARWIIGA